MSSSVTFPGEAGATLTLTVWQADAQGNKIGNALDPSLYAVTISGDTGAASVNGNVVTPDPNGLADGESFTLTYKLSSNPSLLGSTAVVLTGEATQLVATVAQEPASN